MDRDELLRRLSGFEGIDFEVKAAIGGVPDDAYKTVSAFANTSGGWLVFGVSERRGSYTVTGVSDPDRMQNDFVTACRSPEKFSRPVDILPRLLTIEGATVLCFRVPSASRFDKPVRVRSRKTWESYVRIGSADHLCSLEEEARFLRDASLESFDDQPANGATIEDLSPRAIRWFRGLLAERRPERASLELDDTSWLSEAGLMREGGTPTHAAILLFGRDRALARLKPAGVLDLRIVDETWMEGSPEHRWDDRELYEDNLVGTLRGAFEQLTRRLPQPFALDVESGRTAARSPDFVSMREALVNLLIHQDYADRNRTARVLWFHDRVIFENPGDSFVPVAAMLDGGVSQLRNPLLARMLRQAGFAEQAGTGIMAIVRAWRSTRRRPPRFDNDPGRKQFSLTLPWEPLVGPETADWLWRLGLGTDEDAGRLLAVARSAPVLTWVDARLTTGMAQSRLAALIARLVSEGRLAPAEDHPEEAWVLAHGGADSSSRAEPLSAGQEAPAADVRARELHAIIEARPGLRLPDLVEATGWSAATVKRALAALRAQGRVIFEGAPKTGGYRIPKGARTR